MGQNTISSYSFGEMVVAGQRYTSDLIVFSDRVIPGWWRQQGHRLSAADLDEVFAADVDVLVIGCGANSVMRVPDDVRHAVEANGIRCVALPTGDAVQEFNACLDRGDRVVGAFHLTC